MGADGQDVAHIIQDEGSDLAKRKKLNFAGAGVIVTDDSGNDASKVTITSGGGGEANTSSNVGTGEGLAKPKVGVDLPFKSLIGDTEIELAGNLNDITLSISALIARLTTKLDDFGTPDDNTDLDATISLHGLFAKLDKVKLDGIASLAEVNPDLISQAEAEAGSATTERIFSALRVKQAIDALGGGGGGLTFAKVVKSADETITSSTTLQDDDELRFTPNINTTYHFIILLVYRSVAVADLKYAFSIPAGSSGEYQNGNNWSGNGARATNPLGTSQNILTNNVVEMSEIHGRLIMGGTAGDFILQWAQRVSDAGNSTMLLGSLLLAWEE